MTVNAGVCRFITKIHAIGSDDYMSVRFIIESDCPNVKEFAAAVGDVDSMNAVAAPIMDNELMKRCSEFLPHPACPVPCALVKACEVAIDSALKKDVTFNFQ